MCAQPGQHHGHTELAAVRYGQEIHVTNAEIAAVSTRFHICGIVPSFSMPMMVACVCDTSA